MSLKKNPYKPLPGMRYVQVDHKTQIEVRIEMTDEEAIERYLERVKMAGEISPQHKRAPRGKKI